MPTAMKMMLASLALSFSMLGHADTVSFDDVPSGTSGSFQSGGFDFSLTAGNAIVINTQACSPPCPVNGTNVVQAVFSPSSLVMSKPGGGTFGLLRFDGAGSFNFNELNQADVLSKTIDVTGVLPGGGLVTQSFQIDNSALSGPLPFTSFVFNSSFSRITSATFTASGSSVAQFNGFAVDNIQTLTLADYLTLATNAVQALAPADVAGIAQRSILLNLLNVATIYQAGPYRGLSLNAVNAVITRVDGCALRGLPDTVLSHGGAGMDFVTTCPAQAPIYGWLKAAQSQLMVP